jgi:hypothetical protein
VREALRGGAGENLLPPFFAFGQTSSGKTYTMRGVTGDKGIDNRARRLSTPEAR